MTIKNELAREVRQLFLAACYFMKMAKEKYDKLDPPYQKMCSQDLAKKFEDGNYSNKDESALITVACLSSSAIRISTIFEAIKAKPREKTLLNAIQDKKKASKYLCHYLRDNVGHREPEPNEEWITRQEYLNKLTIEEIFDHIREQIIECYEAAKKLKDNLEELVNDKKITEKIKYI